MSSQNRDNGREDQTALPERVHLYDYLIILARNRWRIIGITLGGTVLVGILTIFLPQTFSSSSTLMPPESSGGMNFASIIKEKAGLDMLTSGENPSAERFARILQSRTLSDTLVRRLNVFEQFEMDSGDYRTARDRIQGNLSVETDKNGMITVIYAARTGWNPDAGEKGRAAEFAARVVNEAVTVLDLLNREKATSRARQARLYLDRVKAQKRTELDSAQTRMLRFQRKNKAFALDMQVEALVSALAELEKSIQMKELQLAALQAELNPDTRLVENLRQEIRALRAQKAKLEAGNAGGEMLGLSVSGLPALAQEYAMLQLDLKVLTQVYTELEVWYQRERVEEERDTPTVSVLDYAEPPLSKSAPKRSVILFVALVGFSILALFITLVGSAYRTGLRNDTSEKAEELRRALRSGRRGKTSVKEA